MFCESVTTAAPRFCRSTAKRLDSKPVRRAPYKGSALPRAYDVGTSGFNEPDKFIRFAMGDFTSTRMKEMMLLKWKRFVLQGITPR
jgi:hypothetical protein